MKITIECPHGTYDREMKINCDKTGGRCAHQRYKPCRGWWVLTDQAKRCPAREVKDETNKKHSN